jgi:hypothetical protein
MERHAVTINMETKHITETMVRNLDKLAEELNLEEVNIIVGEPLKYHYWDITNEDIVEIKDSNPKELEGIQEL